MRMFRESAVQLYRPFNAKKKTKENKSNLFLIAIDLDRLGFIFFFCPPVVVVVPISEMRR